MDNVDKKHFSCPKCGAGYRVVFNGKRYQCKRCPEIFTVPDDTAPESAPDAKANFKKASKIGCFVLLGMFLLLSFFVHECDDNTDKTADKKESAPIDSAKIKIREEMYFNRLVAFKKSILVPETSGIFSGCQRDEWNIRVIVTDAWYSMPPYEQERIIKLLQVGFERCSAETGFRDTAPGRIYIYDQYGKQLGYWSSWSGAKLEN